MYFRGGQYFRKSRVLERNLLAGCARCVEMPFASFAADRVVRSVHEADGIDDSFVRQYVGGAFDNARVAVYDIFVQCHGCVGDRRVLGVCCRVCGIHEFDSCVDSLYPGVRVHLVVHDIHWAGAAGA